MRWKLLKKISSLLLILVAVLSPMIGTTPVKANGIFTTEVSSLKGKLVVNSEDGNYIGYSLDYSKTNSTGAVQTKTDNQGDIRQKLGINEEQLGRLRMLLAFSPASHWKQIQEDWPILNVKQGLENPATWTDSDLEKADLYFQYIFWGYLANIKNDEENFKTAQPEAYNFLNNNPELVKFYSDGELEYGAFLDNINLIISNFSTKQAHAEENYGPFSISADLSEIQEKSTLFKLEKLPGRTSPVANSYYYEFVDESGNEITEVKENQLFFLRIEEGVYNGHIEFTASNKSIVSPLFMYSTLFSNSEEGDIFAVPLTADDNLMSNESNFKVSVKGKSLDTAFVSDLTGINEGINISNQAEVYAGYSLDYNKTNSSMKIQNKTVKIEEIQEITGLDPTAIEALSMMMAYSPNIRWETIKSDWPSINTAQGLSNPSSWEDTEQLHANTYFQYVFWAYIAELNGDVENFKAIKPEAHDFVQNNPELVAFYKHILESDNTVIENTQVKINPPIEYVEYRAGETVGPFTVTSNLPADMKASAVYDLMKPAFGAYPSLNSNMYKFVDDTGDIIKKVKEEQPFYIKLSKNLYSGKINFNAVNFALNEGFSRNEVLFSSEGEAAILSLPLLNNDSITNSHGTLSSIVLGQTTGQYIWEREGTGYGIGVKDTLNSENTFDTFCSERNVYLIEGAGHSNVITDPEDIAEQMEVSLETLYRLRYIVSQSPIYTNEAASFIGKYPETYKKIDPYGGEHTIFFNEDSLQNDDKLGQKMYNIAQFSFWYALSEETHNPRYELKIEDLKEVELNTKFIEFFYNPMDSSKSLPDLNLNDSLNINGEKSEINLEDDVKKVGPYTIDGDIDDVFTLNFEGLPEGEVIELVDNVGTPITEFSYNQEFYMHIPKSLFSMSEVTLNVVSKNEHVVGYDEKYFSSDYSQNLYTLNPIKGSVENKIVLSLKKGPYELSFDPNYDTEESIEPQILLEGEVGKTVVRPKRKNHLFEGWNKNPDGSGKWWEPGKTPMEDKDVIIYAQWEKEKEDPVVDPEDPVVDPEDPGVDPEDPVVDPEDPGVDPEDPGVDPEDPGVDPVDPGVDPEDPGVDPEDPGVDPEDPGVDPEDPGVDSEDPANPVEPTQGAKPVETEIARTGDTTNLTLYIILGAVALVRLVISGVKKSRNKKNETDNN